jgi:hypothetical protein
MTLLLLSLMRAHCRCAEFGFFGLTANSLRQTPRRCGFPFSAGLSDFTSCVFLQPRMTWFSVALSGGNVMNERLGMRIVWNNLSILVKKLERVVIIYYELNHCIG